MEKIGLGVVVTVGMAGFLLAWALLWSVVVAWAWNLSMPHVSSGRLPTIDYWQAYGLTVIAGLFKSTATATSKD